MDKDKSTLGEKGYTIKYSYQQKVVEKNTNHIVVVPGELHGALKIELKRWT